MTDLEFEKRYQTITAPFAYDRTIRSTWRMYIMIFDKLREKNFSLDIEVAFDKYIEDLAEGLKKNEIIKEAINRSIAIFKSSQNNYNLTFRRGGVIEGGING